MKILLINPPSQTIQEPHYDIPSFPRTGLAYLAGALKKTTFNVELLDCKFDRLASHEALKKIAQSRPDVIGLTAFTNEIIQAAFLASEIKKIFPHMLTIIGGVHVSSLPSETLKEFTCFDYAVIGEGEVTLCELLSSLNNGQKYPNIPGVAYLNSEGEYSFGGEREKIKNLDDFPLPAWELFRPASYYILHTQRGCPYHCLFCVNPHGQKVREESVSRVLSQVQQLYDIGCRYLSFGDEIFTVNRSRTEELCLALIERNFHKSLTWKCTTHVNHLDLELLTLMKKAGCTLVGIGIETASDDQLKLLHKKTSIQKVMTVVSYFKKIQLPFEGFFTLGHPNESRESMKQTIDLAIKINPDVPILGIIVPYPGTEVYEMAKSGLNGYRLLSKNWNEYNKQIGNALIFGNMSRYEIEKIQIRGYISILLKNYRYLDFLKLSWRYRYLIFSLFKKNMKNILFS